MMGKNTIRVHGLDKVLTSLNKLVAKVSFRTQKGMIAAGLTIQREAQKLTPVDTGNLRASAFTIWGTGGRAVANFKGRNAGEMSSRHAAVIATEQAGMSRSVIKPEVEVGFTAAYALYVHEDTEMSHLKRNKEGAMVQSGEDKFLEKAVARHLPEIIAAIKTEGAG